MAWPEGVAPRRVTSRDGTSIAVFRTAGHGPPLLLVHGTAGDHTTFRALGPLLEATYSVSALDRRGRGASGDGADYDITREFEDVAAVAEAVAAWSGAPTVDVFGHSLGGRAALGAALRTDAIRRVISYEGAPSPPGADIHPDDLDEDLARLLAAGDRDAVLATFMRRVVGMTAPELDAYRANPVWPLRVATAATIVRELAAEASPEAGLDALGAVRRPVLQVLGGSSRPGFRAATEALDARLADGRVVVIAGAKHAAHHTHPRELADAMQAFLRD